MRLLRFLVGGEVGRHPGDADCPNSRREASSRHWEMIGVLNGGPHVLLEAGFCAARTRTAARALVNLQSARRLRSCGE